MATAAARLAFQDLSHALVAREYGIAGAAVPLGGEGSNFLIDAGDGRRFVLKFADTDDRTALEHAAMAHLAAAELPFSLPRTVPARSGAAEVACELPDGSAGSARLMTYVGGTPWYERRAPATGSMRHELGRMLGSIDRALEGFRHPDAARTHPWDLTAVDQHRPKVRWIDTAERRRLAESMFHLWAACARLRFGELPRSVIHGDANDENVLLDGDRVAGLVDFGDALENPTVCELAIALAYAMLPGPELMQAGGKAPDAGAEDPALHPLRRGAEVVAAYHERRPLSAAELAVLCPLVCGRLAVTVSVAAERRRIDPHHPTWFITEDRAWRLIEELASIDPIDAAHQLAAGTSVAPAIETGPPPDQITASRRRHQSAALSIAYREPLEIVRGDGQYLYDHRGRPYLDLVNNVCHVGHAHPRVVDAGARQMARLNTNTRYLHELLTTYAERLVATLPAPLEVCFFVNSGSEANELALRLARTHTGARDVIVVDGAYHGNTDTLVAMSPYKFNGPGGTGVPRPWVHVAPCPDGYRGVYRGGDRTTGEAYGDAVGEVLRRASAPVAAFFAEPLLSCAGQIVPPDGYFETAFRHVRGAGGVCVIDEVQTGFGRVGSHFWGFERHTVVPDIVVMGKPIGNGHPIGAVVTTRAIANSFENGMEFFSSCGGNPVSCAIGLAVLDVIRDEALQARAARLGARLLDGLRELASRHSLIGDVRGAGLFLGVELVRNRETLEPADTEAAALVNCLKDRGLLLSTDGPYHNVIKIKPPTVLSDDDADMFVRALDDEL
jgi:4-aminobutyrate aminotransferase-like enzyme/Ser/Thr protein kinase RdoA (MazF antagonist)